jgi:hypothetical protein
MHPKINRWILILSVFIVLFSLIALLINYFIYQYPGNNYFPNNTIHIGVTLVLFYIGLVLLGGGKSKISGYGLELLYFFGVMSLVALATNAVQLTPFPTIDKQIIAFETLFHINMETIVAWTHSHSSLNLLLGFIYDSLTNQMCFIPLFILAMGRFDTLRDYYFLLLFTALFGFIFYYFYPTIAPASALQSPYFTPYQMATGLKFNQIHHHILPTTIEGGLIALPSFHTIWAILCIYLLKEWFIAFYILLVINIILIASCILLGWHYPIDVLSGVLLTAVGYYFLIRSKKSFKGQAKPWNQKVH